MAAAAEGPPPENANIDFTAIAMWLIDPDPRLANVERLIYSLAAAATESDGPVHIYPQYSSTKGAIAIGFLAHCILAPPNFRLDAAIKQLVVLQPNIFKFSNFSNTTPDTMIGTSLDTLFRDPIQLPIGSLVSICYLLNGWLRSADPFGLLSQATEYLMKELHLFPPKNEKLVVAHLMASFELVAPGLLQFVGPRYWSVRDETLGQSLIESASISRDKLLPLLTAVCTSFQVDSAARLNQLKSRLLESINAAISQEIQIISMEMKQLKEQELLAVAAEKDALAKQKLAFEEEKKFYETSKIQSSKIIKLNVGGTKFETTVETLTKVPDSMLSAMFSGRFPVEPGEDGHFFFDRDARLFPHILAFLRTGVISMPQSAQDKRELLREAEYYQIKPLISSLAVQVPFLPEERRDYTVAMYGLDASGKTTLVRKLIPTNSALPLGPTIGFNVEVINFGNHIIRVWDFGGNSKIRPHWVGMFSSNTAAIIWVVDGSDVARMAESKHQLQLLLANLSRVVPVLILCNKLDKPTASPLTEIASQFGTELGNAESCTVMGCSAQSGQGVAEAMDWLCDQLDAEADRAHPIDSPNERQPLFPQ